jgi:hypothetical protein
MTLWRSPVSTLRRIRVVPLVFLLGVGWPAALANAQEGPAAAPGHSGHAWMGTDGSPLPFRGDEEMMEFMRTAKMGSLKVVGTGINLPRTAILERDGVRMRVIFRDVDEFKDIFRGVNGTTELFYRDSYLFEVAAFELSRLLGLDFVPPAVLRNYNGQKGSVQVWIENAINEGDRVHKKINPPDLDRWKRGLRQMHVWDALIYNIDRNEGNILYGPDWKFWSIDHTRTFRRYNELKDPKLVTGCDRTFWEKLHSVNDETIRTHLKPYLQKYEIDGLLSRRKLLVALLQKLIDEQGEDEVLFTLR